MKPGLTASCGREVVYSSLRFSLYPLVKKAFQGRDLSSGFFEKFGAGLVAGAVGSSIANPADLVKIRLQSKKSRHAYTGALDALRSIYGHEGLRGLYRGVGATCMRSALITAGQLSSYDHTKQVFKANGWLNEGFQLHMLASLVSGLVAATCCAPADRLKTMMMLNQEKGKVPLLPLLVKIVREDGLGGLYKGWLPSYLRLAPHFIIVPIITRNCRNFILSFNSRCRCAKRFGRYWA